MGSLLTWLAWYVIALEEYCQMPHNRAWRKANKRTLQNQRSRYDAILRGADPDLAELVDRQAVWGRDEGHCRRCCVFVPFDAMHLDHIVSPRDGGQHTYNNVQTLCEPCNIVKFHREERHTRRR